MGYVVPNRELGKRLWGRNIQASANLHIYCPAQVSRITAGACGRLGNCRNRARATTIEYQAVCRRRCESAAVLSAFPVSKAKSAITEANRRHHHGLCRNAFHDHVAYERFTRGGPLGAAS